MKPYNNSCIRCIKTLVAIMLLASVGCERDANIDVPQSKAKLVLRSFISPDDTIISVRVDVSQPLYNSGLSNFDATAASVKISNGTVEFPLIYNNVTKDFEIATIQSFSILPGKSYRLNVSHPQLGNANATCTIPLSTVPQINVKIDYTDIYEIIAQVSFSDIAGEKNFYRVFAQDVWRPDSSVFGVDTIVYADFSYDIANLHNDENNDGGIIKSKLINYYNYHPGDSTDVYVLNVDENYYQFMRSVFTTGGGDPFSEAVPVYSNIEGGVGIFASYTKKAVRIQ